MHSDDRPKSYFRQGKSTSIKMYFAMFHGGGQEEDILTERENSNSCQIM